MKNLLIIYPHWPPSNLAGVHRARLVANATAKHGWMSIVLTVSPEYYEEVPDPDLLNTVSEEVEVIHVKAYPVPPIRLIGDIGIRSFSFLYAKALEILHHRQIDFIWIPIPSFYTSLLGRMLRRKTGTPFGIDYIDPWVRDISGRADWRHRLTNFLARFLEPIAVKKTSLITGVSYDYYQPVLKRNFPNHQWIDPNSSGPNVGTSECRNIIHSSFPYGFDPSDHEIKLRDLKTPWDQRKEHKIWLYAGAFLPNSRIFIEMLFKKISELKAKKKWDPQIRLYFLGTGNYPGKSILDYAEENGLIDVVSEDRNRYPFLQVLNLLSVSDTVMVIGSTEKHYTASKIYQALLSKRPVWSIFHQDSTALKTLLECNAGQFSVKYSPDVANDELANQIEGSLISRINSKTWHPDYSKLEKYSANESTRKLLHAIETVLSTNKHLSTEAIFQPRLQQR